MVTDAERLQLVIAGVEQLRKNLAKPIEFKEQDDTDDCFLLTYLQARHLQQERADALRFLDAILKKCRDTTDRREHQRRAGDDRREQDRREPEDKIEETD
jgi:hypothetical protein